MSHKFTRLCSFVVFQSCWLVKITLWCLRLYAITDRRSVYKISSDWSIWLDEIRWFDAFYSLGKYIIDTNELANYLKICLHPWCYGGWWDSFLFDFYLFLCIQFSSDLNYKLDIPWKLISLLGWMIWPRNGKNTNGIFSDDDPLTNGANVHSVTRKKKNPNGRETSDFYWISTFTI